MPLQATSGAASYDAFGGGVPVVPAYIEDCFSTYLYTGNGGGSATGFYGTQTITNGIDLSTKGGLVWVKSRSAAEFHRLFDTARGVNKSLSSNSTNAQNTAVNTVTAFNTTGFNLGDDSDGNGTNTNAYTYASWTFRKAPKFFDVVTYTGNGTAGRQIAHNLGSVPGCIIVKRTDTSGFEWEVYHRSLGNTKALWLNSTTAAFDFAIWDNTDPTSTNFTVGGQSDINGGGGSATYVAYLFAHNAGGFGLTGTDNVISCGSFTTNGSGNATVSLGYEPQWLLTKGTSAGNDWFINDNMRGLSYSTFAFLNPNSSSAETVLSGDYLVPNATGFTAKGFSGSTTFIYIAIRRGPMRVPTSGTSVFSPVVYSGSGSTRTLDATIVPDIYMGNTRTPTGGPVGLFVDRLRGNSKYIRTYDTSAETGTSPGRDFSGQTGFTLNGVADNVSGRTYVSWFMRRAPSFFDEVCYTGTGVNRTIAHNLTVAPELVIIKSRSNAIDWVVGNTSLGFANFLMLNRTDASGATSSIFNNTAPTSSVFSVGASSGTNEVTLTYVAYLFATCAGVSKVGSYTGNGSTQTINCGFTGGARFVLIKKSSGTGDWMVADSARGIVSGNDPYLELNNTNAEVTGEDWLDTDSTGFVVNEVSGSNANTNGATYIFLAIA